MIERVRIERLASGGDGVGRLSDGRVVFVPRTAPGDVADVRIETRKASFARGTVDVLVEPSPLRAAPRCAHYDRDACGGCTLQHLTYDAQLAAKARFVDDALARIAKVAAPPAEIVPNPRPFGWRTRLSLSIDTRTGDAGLRRLGHPDEIFALRSCEIATDALRRLWDALRALGEPWPRRCERLSLREDRGGGLHVVAHGVRDWPTAAGVAAALAGSGAPAALWIEPEGGATRPVAGPPGGPAPSAATNVFEQVDPAMGDAVRDHAIAVLRPDAEDARALRVWDLYAGIGETTARLVAAGVPATSVESVEADPRAVDEATRRGPAGVRRHAARVEDVIDRLGPPDVVVANPPRSGLGAAVTDGLLARAPQRIVYVSCDPATLARDIARLGRRWHVEGVRAFDSFPQTAHVETVAALARRS